MAFLDEPSVDDNAKKSEESVNAVKSLFTFRNGFISRVEVPDYGVDLNVELVGKTSGATSLMFPVQIKSTGKVTLVTRNGERRIALAFKTSRLGYLCRRAPVSGIIVLYDDETQTCYFDYVDALVARLTEDHGNVDWRSQESVTVHLPPQLLNLPALQVLHRRFTQAHNLHHALMAQHGPSYGLVAYAFEASGVSSLNINDPQQVVKLLENFGGLLYDNQEFGRLLDLLSRLPAPAISGSKVILLLAALTYAQVGNVIEAEYHLARCFRRLGEFDAAGIELLEFARLRVNFLKGDASVSDYRNKLAALKAASASPLNALTFEINSVYLALMDISEESIPPGREEIEALFQAIESAPITESNKQMLKLFNSENLHICACNLFLQDATQAKQLEVLGVPVPPELRQRRTQAVATMVSQAIEQAQEVLGYARAQNDQLLTARALQYGGRFFLALHSNLLIIYQGQPPALSEKLHAQYVQKVNQCTEAYTSFLALHLLKDAHQTLGVIYELHLLFLLEYKEPLAGRSEHSLLDILRAIEQEAGFPAFESAVRPLYESLQSRPDTLSNPSWDSDEEMTEFATNYLLAAYLPMDRLPHLLADMKAHQLFARECENEAIELLADNRHLNDPATAYAGPLSYALRDKRTGLVSPPARSINHLLQEFRSVIKMS